MFLTASLRSLATFATICAAIALTACGGGDPPPVQPAGTVIGAAGGTVTGPNGAQVVIPAGALAGNVTIAIAQSAVGAPAVPGGFVAFGQTFAFTPHGTTFAVPVTITVPFDASMVPAGRTPLLYKTNAQSQWELVANATVNAGNLTAQVTSFSWTANGNLPPTITQQPTDASVVEPATASFTVVGSGGATPTLQWQRSNDAGANWFDLVDGTGAGSGATSATYTTAPTSVAVDNNARLRVVITATQGATTSNLVTLTVTAAPPPGACAVTFSGTGAALLPNNCFNVSSSRIIGADEQFIWLDLADDVEILLVPRSGSATDFQTIYVYRPLAQGRIWNQFAGIAIPGIVKAGTQVTFTNVSVPELNPMGAATTLTLNGTLTMPTSSASSLTGTWLSTYTCTGTGGTFTGQDTLTVTQTGTSVSFTEPGGGTFAGTLNGNTMAYSGGGPGYTETGTWTIQDANSFTKTSNYTRTDGSGGGTCPGTGQRQ